MLLQAARLRTSPVVLYTSGDMRTHIVLVGSIIMCCGLVAFSNILQRAQSQLSPEQLATLIAQGRISWRDFFVPVAPVLAAYLLMPVFPDHQSLVAIPAIIVAFVLFGLQFSAAGKRVKALGLPDSFIAARHKANVTLLGSFVLAACFYAVAMNL